MVGEDGMDGERPIKAEAAVQPGGSGLRPTNGARCQARSTARRETGVLIEPLRTAPTGSIARRTTGVLTDTRRTRLTSAALHDLRQGGFLPYLPSRPTARPLRPNLTPGKVCATS